MAFHLCKMERAGRILAKSKASGECIDPALLARAAWRVAVGPKIAAHTVGTNLVRRHLVVEVEDEVWRRQLFGLRGFILKNLARELGDGVVEDIEFRLVHPRKAPGREERPRATSPDESDAIADPVLRSVYQRMRRKSPA